MKATILITLKPAIADPRGEETARALAALGFASVKDLRIGKTISLDLEAADGPAARAEIEAMCAKLLANPVTEDFAVSIEGEPAP